MSQIQDVYIIASGRTPIGSFQGSLSHLSAVELGVHAVKGVLTQSNISIDQIDQLYFGNVVSGNLGQNPARQVGIKSGLPISVPCTTINKVCASGLKATSIGAQQIKLGEADVVIVGGMESMSNAPHYINIRKGVKYGDSNIIDGLTKDGLKDAYDLVPMGEFAELCAVEHNLSREQSDDYAILSYKRAQESAKNGVFKNEIIPISVPNPRRGQPGILFNVDEDSLKFDESKMKTVRPAFPKAGNTVTAPNASSLSDGASALILVSGKWLEKNKDNINLSSIYKIQGYADAECDPKRFTMAPSFAIPKALKHANVSIENVDYFEINEAFSVVALANINKLNIDVNKVNIFGGAVALGHPLGCSGSRILVTLINVLNSKNGEIGVAGICNGGGGATALVIKKVNINTLPTQSNL